MLSLSANVIEYIIAKNLSFLDVFRLHSTCKKLRTIFLNSNKYSKQLQEADWIIFLRAVKRKDRDIMRIMILNKTFLKWKHKIVTKSYEYSHALSGRKTLAYRQEKVITDIPEDDIKNEMFRYIETQLMKHSSIRSLEDTFDTAVVDTVVIQIIDYNNLIQDSLSYVNEALYSKKIYIIDLFIEISMNIDFAILVCKLAFQHKSEDVIIHLLKTTSQENREYIADEFFPKMAKRRYFNTLTEASKYLTEVYYNSSRALVKAAYVDDLNIVNFLIEKYEDKCLEYSEEAKRYAEGYEPKILNAIEEAENTYL